nr:hypothetical protein [Tanacetum cinerariifolium]
MRVCHHVGKHKLHILIDCGSTHNFLDLNTPKKLGCQLTSTCPLQVEVAGGHQLTSKYMCKSFGWKLYGEEFRTNVMVIPLSGCEMVLGIQWLSTLGDILNNFKELRMIELSSMILCVYPTTLHMITAEESKEVPEVISKLLYNYTDVFSIPTALPPIRSCDHQIPLKEGTIPIKSRPYRHPPTQKDAIEVMVKELLDTKVIKDSQSQFSSPVFMVKKRWMHSADVEKTTFKTHEGHYGFLMMPFGLTNAPFTFQALMNSVFKRYLRKFVLVIFDDILVYSPTLEDHVKHLEVVLQALRQNILYAKQSKCVFETKQVEYLGHLLKKNGFGWNPTAQEAFDKLKQAMVEAPVLKLPNFNELVVIETDASQIGIRAVLQQGGHPMAYYSKSLATRHHTLSTYKNELLDVIQALNK